MTVSSWQKGSQAEKQIKNLIEKGGYDGQTYECIVSQKSKFFRQDFFGHDLVCVNGSNFLLCQVKYSSKGNPPRRKATVDAMKATAMPETTKRVLARINGTTQEITWEKI